MAVFARTLVALGFVLLVMWAAAKLLRRTAAGRATDVVEVLGRQQLGRTTEIAVVRIADRAYVLGVGEGKVALIAETDLSTLQPATASAPSIWSATGHQDILPARPGRGALAGSALSLATWRSGVAELRERSVRRA